MVRQTASTVILEILGGLILLIMVVAGLLAFRLASGPLPLGIFKDDIERALAQARSGHNVSIGEVYLEWSQADRRVLVNARDVKLYDEKNELSAEAAHAELVLSGSSLVLGKVEVLAMDLDEGWINVDQVTDTKWKIAGDPLPEIPTGQLPTTPAEWLARANEVLPQLLVALQQTEPTVDLQRASFDNFEVRVRGREGANLLTLEEVEAQLGQGVGYITRCGPAPAGVPSTVVDVTTGDPRLIREGALSFETVVETVMG